MWPTQENSKQAEVAVLRKTIGTPWIVKGCLQEGVEQRGHRNTEGKHAADSGGSEVRKA